MRNISSPLGGKAVPRSRVKDYDRWLPTRFYSAYLLHFPILTVDLVVTSASSEFLLVRRNGKNTIRKYAWATPGGRVHRNETLTDAARRVLLRETGVPVLSSALRFRGIHEFISPKEHAVTVIYAARTTRLDLLKDDTSSAVKWFPSDHPPPSLLPDYVDILIKGGVKLPVGLNPIKPSGEL